MTMTVRRGNVLECGCEAEKVRSVRVYLKEHFPDFRLRDFHAPVRVAQIGGPQVEHHVVGLARDEGLPYHAILLNDFFERSAEDITTRLRRWALADTLRAHRVAFVSKDGTTPL